MDVKLAWSAILSHLDWARRISDVARQVPGGARPKVVFGGRLPDERGGNGTKRARMQPFLQ